jgi:hypothetical protein
MSKVLISEPAATFLGLARLPGSLDSSQAAALLGIPDEHIAPLVNGGLLKALGDPPKNGVKKFATCDILEKAEDPEWLNKAHRHVNRHWKARNEKCRAENRTRTASSETEMAA